MKTRINAGVGTAFVCIIVCAIVIALALFQPLADAAGGYLHWKDLAPSVRTRVVNVALGTYGAGTGTTIGSGGVASSIVLPDYCDTTNCGPLIQTSSVSTFAWPQKLFVRLIDGGGGDVITCTSATIHGRDQWGTPKVETVLTITETGEYTNTVFESISRVVGTGCGEAGGLGGTDALTVQAPMTHIGFRMPFTSEQDFISACLTDDSGNTMLCAELNDGGAADLQSAIDVSKTCGPNADERCFTVNTALSNLWQTVTPEAGADVIRIEFRPRR